MDRHLTLIENLDDSTQITYIVWPATGLAVGHQSPPPDSDFAPFLMRGEVINVEGDDYGAPCSVLALVTIRWDTEDGGLWDETYTFDAAAWDAALLGEA